MPRQEFKNLAEMKYRCPGFHGFLVDACGSRAIAEELAENIIACVAGAAATRIPPEDLLYAIGDDGSDRIEITELVSGDSISIKKEHAGWLARDLIRYAR